MKLVTKEYLVLFEEDIKYLFKQGKINCPIHLSGGNEDQLIGVFSTIQKKDFVISTHRNHYHYLLKGGTPIELQNEIIGKDTGCCNGQGRSMHIYNKKLNFLTSAIVGGGCAIAVGIALACKHKYKNRKNIPHTWCFCGDGAEDTGAFAEAVRFGIARCLPLTFIIEDNDRAVSTTKAERWHNYPRFNSPNIIRYSYSPTYPHVGCGEHVSM